MSQHSLKNRSQQCSRTNFKFKRTSQTAEIMLQFQLLKCSFNVQHLQENIFAEVKGIKNGFPELRLPRPAQNIRSESKAFTASFFMDWTYTATSGSPHTGAKKRRRRLQNCSDLFTVAACMVFVAVTAYSAGFTFQFR